MTEEVKRFFSLNGMCGKLFTIELTVPFFNHLRFEYPTIHYQISTFIFIYHDVPLYCMETGEILPCNNVVDIIYIKHKI